MESVFDRNHRWQQNRIYESIPIQVGDACFNLKNGSPHLLFIHESRHVLTDFLLAFASDAADRYSPDDIRFFVIDMGDGYLYEQAQVFPHFAGGIKRGREWDSAMYLLEEEEKRRSILLRNRNLEGGRASAEKYHKAYLEGTASEPLPRLLVLVNSYNNYDADMVERYNNLFSIIRLCRSLIVNLVMAVNTTEWNPYLPGGTRQVYLESMDSQSKNWQMDADKILSAYRTDPALQQLQQRLLLDEHRWHWDVRTEDGETKTLELICGDLCDLQLESDVVVCSAFKDDYFPSHTSLIGALSSKRYIDVKQLARQPELDFRTAGCWLSQDTGTAYRRIACVELISLDSWRNKEQSYNTIIQKSFSTLRFLLEQAHFSGIQVETIALPLLGTGNQGIDLTYVSTPLLTQCRFILQTNPGVKSIRIYERDADKANSMANLLTQMLTPTNKTCQVFISYSSKQTDIATEIRNTLENNSISCWMAPESIPTGENYLSVIPLALEQVDVLLLLLTPEAERSRWVQKEVGSAVGADKKLLPYQMERFELTNEFRFLLNGEQIMYRQEPLTAIIPGEATANRYPKLVAEVRRLLAEKRINTL